MKEILHLGIIAIGHENSLYYFVVIFSTMCARSTFMGVQFIIKTAISSYLGPISTFYHQAMK